jgi:hypothetical protein
MPLIEYNGQCYWQYLNIYVYITRTLLSNRLDEQNRVYKFPKPNVSLFLKLQVQTQEFLKIKYYSFLLKLVKST